MNYHPLTEIIWYANDDSIKGFDKIIRQWLEEKAEEIHLETRKLNQPFSMANLDRILQLTKEKTLKEKFKENIDKFWQEKLSSAVAQIAEEHFAKGEK